MSKANRKVRNRLLAIHMREEDVMPNGDAWDEATVIRDTLLEAGETLPKACRMAASHVRMWGTALQPKAAPDVRPKDVEEAPVTQVQEPKALPAQAQRVARGEVMRDTKGRILPRATQEAWEELRSLANA